MSFVRLLGWLTARRAKAHWRLMLAAALGVLLATALSAGAMLHSQALAEAGIRHDLVYDAANEYLNLQTFILDRPLGEKDYRRIDGVMGEEVERHINWLFTGMHRYGKTNEIPYVYNSQEAPPPRNIPLATPFFMGGFQEHVRLTSGRWPQPPYEIEGGMLALEGLVNSQAERFINLKEGDTIYLAPFQEAPQEKVAVTIVGVMEPVDPGEMYWFRDLSHFRVSFETEDEDGDFVVPIFVGEKGFFKGLGARYPLILGDYRWYVALDYLSLTAATAPQARQDLDNLEADLNKRLVRALTFSALPGLVRDYQRNLALARVPLFMFVSLVVGVVLYYLVVTTTLQARERGAEAAVLRSRGASILQAGALLGLGDGLVTILPGVVMGPFLGTLVTRLLPIGGRELTYLPPGLSPSVFLAAAVAGAASVLVFTLTGMGVASGSIVGFLRERGRAPQRSPVYRYAIDVLALAAVGVLWWQIRSKGGLLSRPLQGGGISVDLALLLGPAIALLATGLAMLRLVPLLLRLFAGMSSPIGATWLVHGLRRMAREPLAYGALAVLLMLATALGVFGAAFGATLTKGQADVTRYQIGGEVVTSPQIASLDVKGVESVMAVYRSRLGTPGNPQGTGGYTLMAVTPSDLPKVTWFREDFAQGRLEDILQPLREPLPVEQGILLPEGAETLGLWVKGQRSYTGYELRLRLRDARGRYGSLSLGDLKADVWTYMDAPLPRWSYMEPPLYLSGILIRGGSFTGYGSGWLALDDLTAQVGGEPQVVEDFEIRGPWIVLPNLGTAKDVLDVNLLAAHTGLRGMLFTWTHPVTTTFRGLVIPSAPVPLPAIASTHFSAGQRLIGVMEGQPVEISVEGVLNAFPTLNPGESPFFIISLDHMIQYLLSVSASRLGDVNELWLSLKPEADRAVALAKLQSLSPLGETVRDRETQAEISAADPLLGGAWESIALQGAIALGCASLLGFGLYAGITVRRSRLELGVLQALGFSRRHMALLLATEGAMVGMIGLGVGTAVGAWLSRWTLGFMSVTAGGRPLAPPLLLTAEVWLLALALAEVVLAVVGSVVLAMVLANKLRLHEVLRMEE